jgi:hypothetical protein
MGDGGWRAAPAPARSASGTKEWREEPVYEFGWMVLPEFQGRRIAVAPTAQAIEVGRQISRWRPRWGYRRAHQPLLEQGWRVNR